MEHEGDGNTNYNWRPWNCPYRFEKKTGGIGNQRNKDPPALLKSGRIQKRVEETCCQLDSSERSKADTNVKNSVIINKNSRKQ